MENATGDRKSSESEKHFIAGLNGRALGFLTNAVGEKKKKRRYRSSQHHHGVQVIGRNLAVIPVGWRWEKNTEWLGFPTNVASATGMCGCNPACTAA